LKGLKEQGEFGFERIMIGRQRDQSAVVSLSDAKGNPRIRLVVDPAGDGKIEFLDGSGVVTRTLP
jgi:hypothetical protein